MMKTVNLLLLGAILILSSCNFNLGKKGNGNVQTQERDVSEDFSAIRATAGIDVYLTQGNESRISVEADENLLDLIKTDIKNGKLNITVSENIGWHKAKKVYVTFSEINSVEAESGSRVVGNSVIKSEKLWLKSNSGAEMDLNVFSKELKAETSSGAEMTITGKASSFNAKASSGSEIDAKELSTIICNAYASSGAKIIAKVKDSLEAHASSGGDIDYYGNPISVNSKKNSSGSVKRK